MYKLAMLGLILTVVAGTVDAGEAISRTYMERGVVTVVIDLSNAATDPIAPLTFSTEGNATYLGKFSGGGEGAINMMTEEFVAGGEIMAADGDKLIFDLAGQTATIIDGTGRFLGASGYSVSEFLSEDVTFDGPYMIVTHEYASRGVLTFGGVQATQVEFTATQSAVAQLNVPDIRIAENGNIHVRGALWQTAVDFDTVPDVTVILEVNANYDAMFQGTIHSTWWAYDPATDELLGEGVSILKIEFDAQNLLWRSEGQILGHYFAGPMAGGQMMADITIVEPTPIWIPGVSAASLEGRFLMPAGKQ